MTSSLTWPDGRGPFVSEWEKKEKDPGRSWAVAGGKERSRPPGRERKVGEEWAGSVSFAGVAYLLFFFETFSLFQKTKQSKSFEIQIQK